MPIFTAAAIAITGAAAGSFIVGATAFGLQIAAGVGLNLLAQQIAGTPETPAAAAAPAFSIQGSLGSGADQPRSFTMGWRATAGSLVYANTWGKANGNPNGYLTQVIALSDMPQRADDEGLVGLWVNGEPCAINWEDDGPANGSGHPVPEYFGKGINDDDGERDHLWIKYLDGTQTVADSFLTDTVSSAARPWQSTRVGTGVAYAIATARINDTLFSSLPKFKFELAGIPLYDVSKDTTAGGSGSHRWNNPATWGGDGDDLPAVQIYNLLRGITFDSEWFYGLQGLTAARLPAAHWIAQIEKCRAAVDAPGGGSEPRYRSSIEVSVGTELASTIEALLTACQGRLSEIGGVYKLYCGTPDGAVMSFTDSDIVSTEEQTFTPFFGLSDTITGMAATYPSPEEGWNNKPAPTIYRTDLDALAGNRRLLADVSLNTVPYARQVQQLMQEALQEGQRARRHTHTLPPRFWPLEPGDIVSWTSTRNGYAGKLFRVDGVVDQPNLDVMVDFTEIDPSDYDWDTGADYRAPVIGPTAVVRPPAQTIVDFDVEGYVIRDDLGLPRRPGILLTWTIPEDGLDDIDGVAFEVRLASDPSEIVSRGRTDNASAGSLIISQSLLPETAYGVRGRFIPGSAREVEWSTWLSVTTPNVAFGLADFTAALQFELREKIDQIARNQEASDRLLGSLIAEQDAANAEDKTRVTTEIIRARGLVTAAYRKEIILSTGPESALAQAIEDVSAAVDGVEANLKVRFVAGVAPGGALARYDAIATAESASAGLSVVAFDDGEGGAFGHVYVEADRFYITGGDADPTPFFIIDTIEDKVYIDGDLVLPGSIKVGALDAATIAAINAAFDTATITNLTAANISSFYAMYNNLGYISTTFTLSSSKSVGAGAVGGSDEVLSSPAFAKTFTAPGDGMFLLFNAKAQVVPSGFANRGAKLEALFEVLENGSLIATYSFGPAGSYGADGAAVGVEDYQWRFVPVTNGATVVVRLKFRIYRRWYNNPSGSSTNGHWDLTAAAGSCAALALFPNGVL